MLLSLWFWNPNLFPDDKSMQKKTTIKTITFFGIFLCLIIFLYQAPLVFPSEEIASLAAQGEQALARGDISQAYSLGQRILNQDPANLAGYQLVLVFMVESKHEDGFEKLIRFAQENGVSKEQIFLLAAQILYLGTKPYGAYHKLIEYENAWYETRKSLYGK